MASQLIELEDGILIEVDVPETEVRQISGGGMGITSVQNTIDALEPLLLKVCKPVANVLSKLKDDVSLDEVEINLGLGLETQGNFFIATGTAKSSLNIKLKLTPKP